MLDTMKEATHSLLQNGKHMCIVAAIHPPSVLDMTNAYDSTARAFQSDCKGGSISNSNNYVQQGTGALITSPLANQKWALQKRNLKYPWCVHQLIIHTVQGYCNYAGYLGRYKKYKEKKTIQITPSM